MLAISKPSANRVDIALTGTLDAAEMREALARLIAAAEDITDGQMYYTISDFAMPTLGAMAVELYQMPKLFGLIKKFKRCAVLSDTAWIRTAAEIEGVVFRTLEIKSFALNDTIRAEAWLSGHVDNGETDTDEDNFPV